MGWDAPGLDWYAGMSAGNVAEFQAAAQGERDYRPLVERLAADAMANVEAGGIQVAGNYQLPEVDRRALAARHQEDGYLQRTRLTYRDGVDGWVDDCIALTQPWGYSLSELTTPTSVWYGTADAGPASAGGARLEHLRPSGESGGHNVDMKILAIDGGGIRGLIPALVLAEIEKRTGRPISSLFDLVAGTSTGAIIACGLTRPHRCRPITRRAL